MISPLSVPKAVPGATSTGNYMIFAGGYSNHNTVDAFDGYSLIRSTPENLSVGRGYMGSTTIGDYALFISGNINAYNDTVNNVDAYDTSLTRSTPTPVSLARGFLAATSIGNYAIYGGGQTNRTQYGSDPKTMTATACYYDTSLTTSTVSNLSVARGKLKSASNPLFAFFCGGNSGSSDVSTVDAYDMYLTRSNPTELTYAPSTGSVATTNVGDYVLVGYYNNVGSFKLGLDAYDTSLTRSNPTLITGYNGAATNLEDFALFSMQYSNSTITMDVYDTSLTKSTTTPLSSARGSVSATSAGDYAMFAGGWVVDYTDAYYIN